MTSSECDGADRGGGKRSGELRCRRGCELHPAAAALRLFHGGGVALALLCDGELLPAHEVLEEAVEETEKMLVKACLVKGPRRAVRRAGLVEEAAPNVAVAVGRAAVARPKGARGRVKRWRRRLGQRRARVQPHERGAFQRPAERKAAARRFRRHGALDDIEVQAPVVVQIGRAPRQRRRQRRRWWRRLDERHGRQVEGIRLEDGAFVVGARAAVRQAVRGFARRAARGDVGVDGLGGARRRKGVFRGEERRGRKRILGVAPRADRPRQAVDPARRPAVRGERRRRVGVERRGGGGALPPGPVRRVAFVVAEARSEQRGAAAAVRAAPRRRRSRRGRARRVAAQRRLLVAVERR
mmetsp:Transcript_12570/g.41984  ORF Transcript_12570/g.41984 Transcript_12570/m.41984 type:complete len:354 (-) Transcript_12570:1994-3055(-)